MEFKGNWEETTLKMKQKFNILTDRDLRFTAGKEDELLGRLELILGRSKEELHKIITDFQN